MFLAAQGYEYTFGREQAGMEAVPKKLDLSINRLLEKWGIKINEDILMDENSQVIQLNSGQSIGPFALQMPVKFPNQIVVREEMINRSAAITRRIPSLMFLWGSALDLAENTLKAQNLKSTVLFTSSSRSWTMPYSGVNLTDDNTRTPAKDLSGQYPLAALIEGQFSDTQQEAGVTMSGPQPGRMLIVGCSQAFNEDLLQAPGNLNLFANAVDGLLLGEDLIQIRSKTVAVRGLRQLSNAEKLWYRFFAVLLIPSLLFLAALTRYFIRRKEKEFYLDALKSAGTT